MTLIDGALRSVCIFIPFIAFQAYGYHNLCRGIISDETRPWCKARVPFLYDFLQGHYCTKIITFLWWLLRFLSQGVGFLKYFQLKQLPNFLLASPILSLALCSIAYYVKLRPEIVFSLGFRASSKEKNLAAILYGVNGRLNNAQVSGKISSEVLEGLFLNRIAQTSRRVQFLLETQSKLMYDDVSLPSRPTPLSGLKLKNSDAAVATRFLSSSPPLYWFSSYLMAYRSRCAYFIWAYSAAYILLGSLLFSNFYPFT
ncbi:hypothetical protein C5167_006619 [Papaver somniferum]|uniref:GPI mannosyltransferase 2 n=1 Tax=Papaver somniferum TaxID=3469 RepID=A0A4Y7JFL3_PAPSO|nr:hypothetical protein C5167_006619 [Papaver somniferum]